LETLGQQDPLELDERTEGLFAVAKAKLYWDDAYFKYLIFPYRRAAYWLAEQLDWRFWHDYVHKTVVQKNFHIVTDFLTQPVDKGIIDRGFNSLGRLMQIVGQRIRVIQTGYVRTYAWTVLLGTLLVVFIILFPVIRGMLGL
jgi:NADH-quinone oxidoreductase subunit L